MNQNKCRDCKDFKKFSASSTDEDEESCLKKTSKPQLFSPPVISLISKRLD